MLNFSWSGSVSWLSDTSLHPALTSLDGRGYTAPTGPLDGYRVTTAPHGERTEQVRDTGGAQA